MAEGRHREIVPPVERLTGRQKQILDLLCQNMTSHQVGAALGICARTVDNHCVRICRTLEVADRFEAVRIWSALGDADESCAPRGSQQQRGS